jgi:hypothetical protein
MNQENTTGDEKPELSKNGTPGLMPGFKFRLIMTIVFFILALVYIFWLLKLI